MHLIDHDHHKSVIESLYLIAEYETGFTNENSKITIEDLTPNSNVAKRFLLIGASPEEGIVLISLSVIDYIRAITAYQMHEYISFDDNNAARISKLSSCADTVYIDQQSADKIVPSLIEFLGPLRALAAIKEQ